MNVNRPHPGPLPQERENRCQPVGEANAVGNFERRTVRSPLSGGEGQGEGERHTNLFDNSRTRLSALR